MNLKILFLSFLAFTLIGCGEKALNDDVITKNNIYTVTADSVIQGDFVATAVSPTKIITNYVSPADKEFSPIIQFRLALNSRDNELRPGKSHYAIAGNDKIFTLGVPDTVPPTLLKSIKKDTKWTVKVNMGPLFRSFKSKGYYVTATGDTIFKEDFHGVWIAGGATPLNWTFDTLYGKREFKLSSKGNDSIYSTTITLNPSKKKVSDRESWEIEAPNPDFPSYTSNETLVDALYNMSIDNISDVRSKEHTYFAGESWKGVWTRDVSYSAYLALAYLDPKGTINSLKAKVKDGKIIQDTGTGGSWPVSTDRIVWGIAAWEVYKVTGNKDWLKYSYNVIKNTLAVDKEVVWDKFIGLMHGEQSYLDWREQSYPKWMQPKDIYESMCLGTNVLFAQTYEILGEMSEELGLTDNYDSMYNSIKDAINQNLWREDEGYYSEYLYGGIYPMKSPGIDNLGQALSVIWNIADDDRAETLMEKTPVTDFGTPSIFPRIKDIPPYHNDAVWPFVQAFWNIAAARTQNEHALRHGLGAMYRAAALFATNKELMVASTGDFRGTEINSNKQLWSSAGNVAMIFRIFAGMEFKTNGIQFEPFVPACIKGKKTISNFKYRKAVLNLTIDGVGHEIEKMTIDGEETKSYFFPAELEGKHDIVIKMSTSTLSWGRINISPMEDMPITPSVIWNGNNANIENFEDGIDYDIYANDSKYESVSSPEFSVSDYDKFTKIYVVPEGKKYSGFMSRPRFIFPGNSLAVYQIEHYAESGCSMLLGNRAKNYVEITPTKNTDITIPVIVESAGTYFIDVRYANGNGPINTDNKCALRSLIVNTHNAGGLVMPQRGVNEWYDTGFSNMLQIELLSGENIIQIKYIPSLCTNMNGKTNNAIIDYLRLIKK